MKTLTREIMLERIETKLTENGLQKKFDFTELLESDFLSLFIEFAEELIGEDEKETLHTPIVANRGYTNIDHPALIRNHFRSALRAKLEELRGEKV